MIRPSRSPIVRLASRILAVLIQIFAFYVIFHGHFSPGGGFQGGSLLAASILLLRMTEGSETSQAEFRTRLGTPLSAAGALAFALIGLMAVAGGGMYLDHAYFPWPGLSPADARSFDILLIELAVGVAVMATLISIFDDLADAGEDDG